MELRIGETFCQVLYPVQAPGEADIHWSSVRVGGEAGALRTGGAQARFVRAPDLCLRGDTGQP